MAPLIVSLTSCGLYFISAYLIYSNLRSPVVERWKQLSPALVAILLQSFLLQSLIYQPSGLDLGIMNATALISWVISIQILFSSIYKRIEALGIFLFPLTAIALLAASFSGQGTIIEVDNGALQGHILLSVIAYSLVALASCHALLLAYQDHSIRAHNPGGFIRLLPPIHDMETLLFQFLGCGFLFLSASLISGFFFIEDIFAQKLAHKTVLSFLAWIILGILMFGRLKFGWRGKTAIRWTLSSFGFLLLAFFGSKLVIEIILSSPS